MSPLLASLLFNLKDGSLMRCTFFADRLPNLARDGSGHVRLILRSAMNKNDFALLKS